MSIDVDWHAKSISKVHVPRSVFVSAFGRLIMGKTGCVRGSPVEGMIAIAKFWNFEKSERLKTIVPSGRRI